MLIKLSLMTTEQKLLKDIGSSPDLCDSVIDIFTEKEIVLENASTKSSEGKENCAVANHFFLVHISFPINP
jgi:hypothetical protein